MYRQGHPQGETSGAGPGDGGRAGGGGVVAGTTTTTTIGGPAAPAGGAYEIIWDPSASRRIHERRMRSWSRAGPRGAVSSA